MADMLNAAFNEATRTAFHIVARQQADGGSAEGGTPTDSPEQMTLVPLAGQPGFCATTNDFDGRLGVRISAIFVILVTSLFGTLFPIISKGAAERSRILRKAFFFAKYFGSGVIIATAFIHLLAPANDALKDPCLTGPITNYDWVEGIALMAVFVLFFVELITMRFAVDSHDHTDIHGTDSKKSDTVISDNGVVGRYTDDKHSHQIGSDHFGHVRDHKDPEAALAGTKSTATEDIKIIPEDYAAQMTALFILEFGVIFHSVFIGLTLAVSGDEFNTLYVVLVFHQMFEGLGLGTRLAAAPWPASKRWTPYLMGLGYSITTPIAIAIGLGVRETYAPGSQTALITNGVFDSISAGILLYTGLVELMAHEFMFSSTMRKKPIGTVLWAFGLVCIGAGLMALLGEWA